MLSLIFLVFMGCSCGAVGGGFPRRYLAPALASALEQVVFLPAIQQHPQEGGCAPSRMHVRAIRPMPTVTGIFVISDKTHRSSSAHLHTDNISYQKFSVKKHQTPNTQPYRNSPRNSQPLLFKYTESKFFYREKITCLTHHFHGLRASKSS